MELWKYVYFCAQKSMIKAGDNKFQDLINAPRILRKNHNNNTHFLYEEHLRPCKPENEIIWFGYCLTSQYTFFSVMLGRSRCFLGIYQYFEELKMSCSRTLHGGRDRSWGSIPIPLAPKSDVLPLSHRALPNLS